MVLPITYPAMAPNSDVEIVGDAVTPNLGPYGTYPDLHVITLRLLKTSIHRIYSLERLNLIHIYNTHTKGHIKHVTSEP